MWQDLERKTEIMTVKYNYELPRVNECEVLECIVKLYRDKKQPTVARIIETGSIKGAQSVFNLLQRLERRGYIKREGRGKRIVVTNRALEFVDNGAN